MPTNDFVSKIVKDPKKPLDTVLLVGFLGKSSEKKHTRLYFDASLNSYVEIPDSVILYKVQIPKAQSFLGAYCVWISLDAQLIYGRIGSTRVKASFIEGPIQQEYMRAGQHMPFAGRAYPQLLCGPQPVDAISVTVDPIWCPLIANARKSTATVPICP